MMRTKISSRIKKALAGSLRDAASEFALFAPTAGGGEFDSMAPAQQGWAPCTVTGPGIRTIDAEVVINGITVKGKTVSFSVLQEFVPGGIATGYRIDIVTRAGVEAYRVHDVRADPADVQYTCTLIDNAG